MDTLIKSSDDLMSRPIIASGQSRKAADYGGTIGPDHAVEPVRYMRTGAASPIPTIAGVQANPAKLAI